MENSDLASTVPLKYSLLRSTVNEVYFFGFCSLVDSSFITLHYIKFKVKNAESLQRLYEHYNNIINTLDLCLTIRPK